MYQLRHGELPFSRLLFQKLLVDQRLELLALEGVDLLLELLSCPATGFSNSSEVSERHRLQQLSAAAASAVTGKTSATNNSKVQNAVIKILVFYG